MATVLVVVKAEGLLARRDAVVRGASDGPAIAVAMYLAPFLPKFPVSPQRNLPMQFEKWECTFFNFEFPQNVFQLRQPILTPLPGTLPEPEMHARIVEALGVFDGVDLGPLHAAALDRSNFAAAFTAFLGEHPQLADVAPVLLYRTLGPTLPGDSAAAALLWTSAQGCVQLFASSVRAAGFSGEGTALGDALFDAIISSPNGVVLGRRLRPVVVPGPWWTDQPRGACVAGAGRCVGAPRSAGDEQAYPLVLSAGERRSFTANDIFRDPTWRKRDAEGCVAYLASRR